MIKIYNETNLEDQNNQKVTEKVISKVIQKLKEPKITILVVLLVILSLGSVFVGIYYRQNQIPANPESKTVEPQKPIGVISNAKEPPFLEILDTKNEIPAELEKEPTAIANSGGLGCQPDFFDPRTSKYNKLEQTKRTGSYWAKDIYQIKENDRSYEFSIKTVPASKYSITAYEFCCASSCDYVLGVRNDNKRTSLYTHVNTYYLNDDKNFLFLDNYLKNQNGTYDRKRRIISVDGIKRQTFLL